jgi:steroid 5-alpha reductase family enzyme
VGSSAKQIYWKLFVGDTVMPSKFAAAVAAYNTVLNGLNTLLALWVMTTQQPSDQSSLKAFIKTAPLPLRVGIALYAVGLGTEWFCEVQRKAFKQDPKNKGKPYSGGLFGLARNINYGGYTLWRAGYSLICGGVTPALFVASWLAGDFCMRAIPSMDAYCEKRVSRTLDASVIVQADNHSLVR